jgi:hypothetical protein
MRLNKENYIATQTIYYPGFTIGGASEELSLLAVLILLVLTPAGTQAFWWTLAGLIALAIMHAAYWVLTHPVNKFWTKGSQTPRGERGFLWSWQRQASSRKCQRRRELGEVQKSMGVFSRLSSNICRKRRSFPHRSGCAARGELEGCGARALPNWELDDQEIGPRQRRRR